MKTKHFFFCMLAGIVSMRTQAQTPEPVDSTKLKVWVTVVCDCTQTSTGELCNKCIGFLLPVLWHKKPGDKIYIKSVGCGWDVYKTSIGHTKAGTPYKIIGTISIRTGPVEAPCRSQSYWATVQ